MANPSFTNKRSGTIELETTLHFSYSNHEPITLLKKFEIMKSTLGFLLGSDILDVIFPNDGVI